MIIRVAAAAAVLLFVSPGVAAQQDQLPAAETADEVVLGGWSLPEGSVITSTTRVRRTAEVAYFPAEGDPAALEPTHRLEIHTLRVDSLHTTIVSLNDGLPDALEQFVAISDILEDVREDGEIVDQGRRPDPLSGTRYVAERTVDGEWSRRFVVPETPSPEQLAALNAPFSVATPQYLARPVRVGETWSLGREDLAVLFGDLVENAPQRMTMKLDSVGTYMDRPAAFLTYSVDVVLDQGDGVVMRKHELGMTVRLLDRFVDVLSQWRGSFRSIREGAGEDGAPVRALMEGELHGERQQFIMAPSPAASR